MSSSPPGTRAAPKTDGGPKTRRSKRYSGRGRAVFGVFFTLGSGLPPQLVNPRQPANRAFWGGARSARSPRVVVLGSALGVPGDTVTPVATTVPPIARLVERGLLVAVLAVAATVRCWGFRSGVPFAVGVDEPAVVDRALRILRTGDWNPHVFDYPTLVIYL